MTVSRDADSLLVERIRRGEDEAWGDLITRYEGRLLAFVESRLGRRGPSEDIVQESFVGFLNSRTTTGGGRWKATCSRSAPTS
jgi:RNA polymerase sigma-70 factor (ECF subfamily)